MFEMARMVSAGSALAAPGIAVATPSASTIADETSITAGTVIGARGYPRQRANAGVAHPTVLKTRLQSCSVPRGWRLTAAPSPDTVNVVIAAPTCSWAATPARRCRAWPRSEPDLGVRTPGAYRRDADA